MTAPAWLPSYLEQLLTAAAFHSLPVARLAALVEQESNGGLSPRTGLYDPRQLYRYEPAFWDRYLAGRADYAPPAGAESGTAFELWKRRVSASYGLCQIMYPTARDHGWPKEWPPEALLQPGPNLLQAARILAAHRRNVPTWRDAWLRYNGGGRPAYADEVEARVPRFEDLLA
jgi:hypothetical protein